MERRAAADASLSPYDAIQRRAAASAAAEPTAAASPESAWVGGHVRTATPLTTPSPFKCSAASEADLEMQRQLQQGVGQRSPDSSAGDKAAAATPAACANYNSTLRRHQSTADTPTAAVEAAAVAAAAASLEVPEAEYRHYSDEHCRYVVAAAATPITGVDSCFVAVSSAVTHPGAVAAALCCFCVGTAGIAGCGRCVSYVEVRA